jgi:hypothetical protein
MFYSRLMSIVDTEQATVIWMVDEVPVRMRHAGRRWRVTDMPTRLRESIWEQPLEGAGTMSGWRFQATDEQGISFVFDVFRVGEHEWHVHHTYD